MARSRLPFCLEPGGVEERPRLSVAQRRRLALVALDFRALYPLHRVVGHRIRITEVLEERGERGELAPNGSTAELPALQVLPPGEHVRAGEGTKRLGRFDSHKPHELVDVDPVGAPRPRVVDVRKPLGLSRHHREPLELGGGQAAPIASPGEPTTRHHQLLTLSLGRGLCRGA
jgi:hypothetical protein